MSASSRPDFIVAELDSELLSTPFGVRTNWHVITGAACSGKTTLIKQLANRGFRTIPEIGQLYVEKEMAKGRVLDCYRTYQETIERAEARRNIPREAVFELYQEAHEPPLDSLFVELPTGE